MIYLKKISTALLVLTTLFTLNPTAVADLDRQEINQIYSSLGRSSFETFTDFHSQLTDSSVGSQAMQDIVRSYTAGDALDTEQSTTVYRLLGIYTRLKYGSQALGTLSQLVAIPTFQIEEVDQHENRNFRLFAEVLGRIAGEFGLNFRNVDERVYEITLEGSSEELVGFHAHVDILPVNPDLWILPDGARLDPFEVTLIGGRLYGRGTEDDKNGIVALLYAMKVIQEEGLSLLRNLRLLVDTTEETSSTAIPYYFENNPVPDYNIALDGSYPVVVAEKGYGTVMAQFPVRASSGEGAEILSISGGLATNQIPAASVVRIQSSRPNQLVSELNEYGSLYKANNGDNFQYRSSCGRRCCCINRSCSMPEL